MRDHEKTKINNIVFDGKFGKDRAIEQHD